MHTHIHTYIPVTDNPRARAAEKAKLSDFERNSETLFLELKSRELEKDGDWNGEETLSFIFIVRRDLLELEDKCQQGRNSRVAAMRCL